MRILHTGITKLDDGKQTGDFMDLEYAEQMLRTTKSQLIDLRAEEKAIRDRFPARVEHSEMGLLALKTQIDDLARLEESLEFKLRKEEFNEP
jgi:hypothetical protein